MEILIVLNWVFYGYFLSGLIFGAWFVFRGVQKLDAEMNSANWILRLMILPATMALWPVIFFKLVKRKPWKGP